MLNIYNPNGVVTQDLAILLDASSPASYNSGVNPSDGSQWRDISPGSFTANATIYQQGSTRITWTNAGQASYFTFRKDINTPVATYMSTGLAQAYTTFTVVFRPDLTINNVGGLTSIFSTADASNTGYAQGGLRVYNVNGTGPWLINGNPAHVQDWEYSSTTPNSNPNPTWYNNNSINYGNGLGPAGAALSNGYILDNGWNILTMIRTTPPSIQFPTVFNIFLGSGGIYSPAGNGGGNFSGDIAYIAGYTRKLTNAEQIQNFTSLRNRFNPTMI